MLRILTLLVLAAVGFTVVTAKATSTAPAASTPAPMATDADAKLQAARAYLKLIPADLQVQTVIEQMGQKIKPEQRDAFKKIAGETIQADRLNTAAEVALADIFTVEELNAMTQFFGTETGKSVMKKMDTYQQRLMPIVSDMVTQTALRMQQQGIQMQQ